MTDLEFVNPQIKNIIEKDLSIQVSLSGFSFFIRSSDNIFLAFKHYAFDKLLLVDELIRKAEHIVQNELLFNDTFRKVKVTYLNQKSTLVPSPLFSEKKLKTLVEFNHNLNELDEIHHSYIPTIDSYNIFIVPNYLANVLFEKFRTVSFNHQATDIINYGSEIKQQANCAVINLSMTFFDIAIFDNGKLLLHNSFQYTNAQDFIYFFLYPLSQLKLDPGVHYVHVFGNHKENHIIITELRKRVLKVVQPKIDISIPNRLQSKIDKSAFYSLFA